MSISLAHYEALMEEIKEKDKRIAELEKQVHCDTCHKLEDHASCMEAAINRMGGSPPTISDVSFSDLAVAQEKRIAELEDERQLDKAIVSSQRDKIMMLTDDPKTLSGRLDAAIQEVENQCAGMECDPGRCPGCECTKLLRILRGASDADSAGRTNQPKRQESAGE